MSTGLSRSAAWVAQAVGGTLVPGGDIDAQTVLTGPVVTDSRQAEAGSLFVAVAGEHTDGHDHATATAGPTGSVLVLASRPVDAPHVLVADTVEALGALARTHLADLRQAAARRGATLTVVGITGSVGKTTTKDLTRQLLTTAGPTVAPRASFNNEIGMPLTVLEADESTRFLVLEMGASGPGHIDYLTAIAPLDLAAVLMVGHAHMGGFGSVEAVAHAKAELVRGLLPTGTAVLNADDPRVAAMAAQAPGRVVTFSAQGAPDAAVRATDVTLDDTVHASFTLHMTCDGGIGGARPEAEGLPVHLALPGAHNVANALAAATVAHEAGVSTQAVADALSGAGILSPHRMDVRLLDGDLLLIDDSYNANIDSMTAALAALPSLAGPRRRVVVVSEMLDLGPTSVADHERTGEMAVAAGADLVVAVGEGAGPVAAVARESGVRAVNLPDATEALDRIDSLVADGDAVLVKGSHGSGAWRLADHLKEVAGA